MKHLVECPVCTVQYDATGRTIGSRFRCHCGEPVTVSQPHPELHLQIIRCCNCGAGREDSRPHCSFCQAEFTLFARDLDVICPHCTERTGKRSKFCHLCGTAIRPLEALGDSAAGINEKPLNCPRCVDSQLVVRKLGTGIAIQECVRCVGIWLPKVMFSRLEARALEQCFVDSVSGSIKHADAAAEQPSVVKYIRCPSCKTLMNRQNYRRVSGIVIDLCVQDGVWFDGGELAGIVTWLKRGGKDVADDKSAKFETTQVMDRHRKAMADLGARPEERSFLGGRESYKADFLMATLEVAGMLVGKLFKR